MIRLWLVLQATAAFKDVDGNLVNVRDRRDVAAEMKASHISIGGAMGALKAAGWIRIDRIPDQHGWKTTIFETPQVPASTTKPNEAGNQVPAEN
jgi:hypothetical protein